MARSRAFFMLPASAPEPEQKAAPDVYAILRNHVAFTAATRAEVRQARRELQEVTMKIYELSSKIDQLVAAASAPQAVPDDPEVERLAKRIDDAIATLEGAREDIPAKSANANGTPAEDPNASI